MLAASSYGIGSVWLNPLMTLRDASPVKELLDEYKIPERHTVWAAIALGYPVADGTALAKRENVFILCSKILVRNSGLCRGFFSNNEMCLELSVN